MAEKYPKEDVLQAAGFFKGAANFYFGLAKMLEKEGNIKDSFLATGTAAQFEYHANDLRAQAEQIEKTKSGKNLK